VDVSLHHDEAMIRPWRITAMIAVAVAAVELLLLVVIGGALVAKPSSGTASRPHARAAAAKSAAVKAAPVKTHRAAVPAAHLRRGKVTVLVLNGNGRQGAASVAASRVSRRGYRIGGVANAPRSDFTRSLVMYRRGFEGEGRRLARDLGIHIVGPLDGLNASQLHGAHAVLVVGA
jgi:hypothetical protein